MKRKTGKQLILLLFLLFAVTALQNFIQQRSRASLLHTDTCFTESFREQALSPLLTSNWKQEITRMENLPIFLLPLC